MTSPSDRFTASARKQHHLSQDKEALAVLAMNDAAITSGQGLFFYLPELCKTCSNGNVKIESYVPNLLYAKKTWTHGEINIYMERTCLQMPLTLAPLIVPTRVARFLSGRLLLMHVP